jgi:hypothetical protein
MCYKGTKSELTKKEESFQFLVEHLEFKLFLDKSQFLVHCLRKLLGGQLRKEIRHNLAMTDAVSYIDFSKGKDCFKWNFKSFMLCVPRVGVGATRANKIRSFWCIKQNIHAYSSRNKFSQTKNF